MSAHVDASDHGKPLLEVAARIIERLAHPQYELRVDANGDATVIGPGGFVGIAPAAQL